LSPFLASVGLFDGVLGELNRASWSGGIFAGTQPEPLQLGWSGSVFQFGAFAGRHNRPGALMRWAFTVGASASYQEGRANRQFVFLQSSVMTSRLNAFVSQEIDYYSSWKRVDGENALSPTSTFALLRFRVTPRITLEGGFDNRRNVRLYRDVTNPAVAFDDAYRQGAWAGVWLEPTRRIRLGFDARASSGGAGGHADAYTVSFNADRLAGLAAALRTRSTRYTNPSLSGWLHAATISLVPSSTVRLELNGGVRNERDPMVDPSRVSLSWMGADLDVTLNRAWYLLLSATRQRGGVDAYDEIFAGLSLRF
jgi:hypothetical protein